MTEENLIETEKRLGRYQLRRRIGTGGMAEVFLALDMGSLGLNRWVAIKRVHPHLAAETRFVEMLFDEARIAARIAHPNIAQVIDLGEADGAPYLVMEYLQGQPLSLVIKRAVSLERELDLDLMCRIVAHACEGIHAAHELSSIDGRPLGLVHRDLSPHNIFVTYEGSVKVMDFGIAKALGRSTRTSPGTRKGKFSYMAPEQVRGGDVDRRCDVYALGLVLYEVTTGRSLFQGHTDLDERARGALVTPPSKHRKSYPRALETIVMRALDNEPEARFETARQLGQELERFIVKRGAFTDPANISALMSELFAGERAVAPEEIPTDPSSAAPIRSETRVAPPSKPKRSPLPLIAGGLIAALLIALIAIMKSTPERAEDAPKIEIAESAPGASDPEPPDGADVEPTVEVADVEPAPALPTKRIRRTSGRAASAAAMRAQKTLSGGFVEGTPPAKANLHERKGLLDVQSDPWATVFLDGREIRPTPLVSWPVDAGKHSLRLVTRDGRSKRLQVKILPGRPTSVRVKF